jgi:hypothetical protein
MWRELLLRAYALFMNKRCVLLSLLRIFTHFCSIKLCFTKRGSRVLETNKRLSVCLTFFVANS